jgi:hypothetical protein
MRTAANMLQASAVGLNCTVGCGTMFDSIGHGTQLALVSRGRCDHILSWKKLA